MTPDHIKELIAGYVLGNLSPKETQEFEQLLKARPKLEQEVDQMRETLALMPYALSETAPPPRVRSNLLNAIDPLQVRKTITPRLLVATGLIAAFFLLSLGLDNYRLRRELAQIKLSSLSFGHIVVSPEVLQANHWDGVTRLLQDHAKSINRQNRPVDLISANPIDIVEQLAPESAFPRSTPVLTQANIQLLGGSVCKLGKIQGIRFTYRLGNDRLISFYQLEASERSAFPNTGGDRLYIQSSDNPGTIIWQQGHFLYAIISELPPDELQQIVASIR
jgi:anti-sigma factor RsiW